MALRIGIAVFEGVEELDFVGPWEVFGMSAELLRRSPAAAEAPILRLLAEHAAPVRCAKGLLVVPDGRLADEPPLDVLVVPGGRGVRRELGRAEFLGRLAAAAAPCRHVTSVCTGSALLVAAGLADGRRVTTHGSYVETLAATGRVQVDPSARFTVDGPIATAAGVSAGIDLALWLVGEWFGTAHRDEVRRQMEYFPSHP